MAIDSGTWEKACDLCLMEGDIFVVEKGINGKEEMEILVYCIVQLGHSLLLVVYGIFEKWENL